MAPKLPLGLIPNSHLWLMFGIFGNWQPSISNKKDNRSRSVSSNNNNGQTGNHHHLRFLALSVAVVILQVLQTTTAQETFGALLQA